MNDNTDCITWTDHRVILNVDVVYIDAYLTETETAPAADPAMEQVK